MEKTEMIDALINHYANGNNAQMARILGITPQGLSTWKSRNTFDIELIYAKCEGLNPEWLLTGKGSMLKGEEKAITIHNRAETFSIPIVEIGAAAGIEGYDNPTYLEVMDKIEMPFNMVRRNSTYYCIRVKGDSMAPTMLNGGYLIVRLLERGEWEHTAENQVYVISTREGVAYVKRIRNHLRKEGFILCTSDNPDKMTYHDFTIENDDLHSMLRVEWYLTSDMSNVHETYHKKVGNLENNYVIMQRQLTEIRRDIQLIKEHQTMPG